MREEAIVAYLDGKHYVAEDLLPRLFRGGAHYFCIDGLREILDREGLRYEPATLRRYLHQWSREGRLHDAGRGWYSDLPEAAELDTAPIQPLIETLRAAFPFLDFAVWSTRQFAPWFHHLLNRHLTFVKVERDAIATVAETLEDAGHVVASHPLGKDAKQFVAKADETFIIRPLLADDSPGEDHTLSTESILVDLRTELERLGFIDSGEYERVLNALSSQFRLQVSDLFKLAKRRKLKESEFREAVPINDLHFFKKSADR
jgi:hypothetical protein